MRHVEEESLSEVSQTLDLGVDLSYDLGLLVQLVDLRFDGLEQVFSFERYIFAVSVSSTDEALILGLDTLVQFSVLPDESLLLSLVQSNSGLLRCFAAHSFSERARHEILGHLLNVRAVLFVYMDHAVVQRVGGVGYHELS